MTKRSKPISIWAGLVGVLLLLPGTGASAQESGAEMWGRSCGRCHRAQPPNKYEADDWRAVMRHMALQARLTPREEEGITAFLVSAARPVAAATTPRNEWDAASVAASNPDSANTGRGAAVFRGQCTACHGAEGKGDGPAAAALTPRPPDLTRSERMRTMSDAELLEFLSVGKGSMPGFGKILTGQELMDVVAWLRAKNEASR